MCTFNVVVFLLPPPRAVIISVTVNSLAAHLTKTYNYYYFFIIFGANKHQMILVCFGNGCIIELFSIHLYTNIYMFNALFLFLIYLHFVV